jgi:hypothetical protein
LTERQLPYVHLERHSGLGGVWDIDNPGSPMYESAHFNSSKTHSAFGGWPMPENFPDYPSHRQILSYLRSFADAYRLTDRIEFAVAVRRVEKNLDGTWTVSRSDGRECVYRNVVVCTGSQWHPIYPDLPGTFTGEIRHAVDYRSPDELRGKRVLVVGGGASACDIVCDAARVADRAVISMRRGYWFIPKHVFGRPADTIATGGPRLPTWLEQKIFTTLLRILNGDMTRLGLQKPDHKLFETHPILSSMLLYQLQHGDVAAKPGITHTHANTVYFTDGTQEHFDVILAATGYMHKVPLAQKYFGNEQHPDLYLSAFSREHQGLFGVGFVETNSAAYPLFDAQAQMIAAFVDDGLRGLPTAERFARKIRDDRPDLSGGLKFINSPRHTGYVESGAFVRHLNSVAKAMNWRIKGNPPALDSVRQQKGVS